MDKRVIPFGETQRVRVDALIGGDIGGWIGLGLDNNEGYCVMGDPASKDVDVGDEGVITFMKGGPMGGYWSFSPSVVPP